MIAAPFSAIMIVDELVLVEVTRWHHRGVDDPQPVEPVHLELVVDDRHRVAPHQAGQLLFLGRVEPAN